MTGFVEDVRDYFAKATVFVVPLRVGGGMRVKLLQAMAMARPVVSTPIGAEGIRVEDGQDLLLADTAPEISPHAWFDYCGINCCGNVWAKTPANLSKNTIRGKPPRICWNRSIEELSDDGK